MNNREKDIISKLLSIAKNQQKVIHKLAQLSVEKRDPIVDYLNKGLVNVVAGNLGIPNVKSEINISPSVGPHGPSLDGKTLVNPAIPTSYNAHIYGVPTDKHQAFAAAMLKQLSLQKPDLKDRFSYSFME